MLLLQAAYKRAAITTTIETATEAEVEATRIGVSQGIDDSLLDELMAMACHHMTLNNKADDDAMVNASHAYKYLLEQVKAMKGKGGECREMIFTMARVKINMLSGVGVGRDDVETRAQENIERLRESGSVTRDVDTGF